MCGEKKTRIAETRAAGASPAGRVHALADSINPPSNDYGISDIVRGGGRGRGGGVLGVGGRWEASVRGFSSCENAWLEAFIKARCPLSTPAHPRSRARARAFARPDLSNKTVNLTLGSWHLCPLARPVSGPRRSAAFPIRRSPSLAVCQTIVRTQLFTVGIEQAPGDDASPANTRTANTPIYIGAEERQ